MKTRTLIAAAAVATLVGGIALSQSGQQPAPAPPPFAPPPVPSPSVSVPIPPVDSSKLEDMTIDQLIDVVHSLRTQKAEMEKKEQKALKILRGKAAAQKERIDGLEGLPPAPAVQLVPSGTPAPFGPR